jgi:hypothetical protein
MCLIPFWSVSFPKQAKEIADLVINFANPGLRTFAMDLGPKPPVAKRIHRSLNRMPEFINYFAYQNCTCIFAVDGW